MNEQPNGMDKDDDRRLIKTNDDEEICVRKCKQTNQMNKFTPKQK